MEQEKAPVPLAMARGKGKNQNHDDSSAHLNSQTPRPVQGRDAAIRTLLALRQRFPAAIARLDRQDRNPLKVGIAADLAAALPQLSQAAIGRALRFYVNGPAYLRACTEGSPRIDLRGEPVGAVSGSEAKHARILLDKILAKRKPKQAPQSAPPPPPAAAPPKKITLSDLREAFKRRREAAP